MLGMNPCPIFIIVNRIYSLLLYNYSYQTLGLSYLRTLNMASFEQLQILTLLPDHQEQIKLSAGVRRCETSLILVSSNLRASRPTNQTVGDQTEARVIPKTSR